MRPPKARTWARRGRTPVVTVPGSGGRVSVAGLACLKSGQPGRFFFRLRLHRRRKGERGSMSEADYAELVTAAHRALAAPVILIWDNLNTHRSKIMSQFTAANASWLTVVQMPAYAPELNPVEGAWSAMKSSLGNLAPCSLDQLAATIRDRLRRIQRQPDLITGLLGQTGLTLECEPP
jgi:DDE superfamily endonuclease